MGKIADLDPALERRLRTQLSVLAQDPHAVFEPDILAQQLSADERLIQGLLGECVDGGILQRLCLWSCPNGFGTTAEADHVSEFPSSIECARCGKQHRLTSAQIETVFVKRMKGDPV